MTRQAKKLELTAREGKWIEGDRSRNHGIIGPGHQVITNYIPYVQEDTQIANKHSNR